jgi:hypothetical protein
MGWIDGVGWIGVVGLNVYIILSMIEGYFCYCFYFSIDIDKVGGVYFFYNCIMFP